MDGNYTQDEVLKWHHALELMRTNAVSADDTGLVDEAVDGISAGAGLHNVEIPEQISTIITNAIAVGYGSALTDVRKERVDDLGPA